MIRGISSATIRVVLAAGALVPLSQYAHAQTPVESSAEARFQLDVHVPDAAIAALLPSAEDRPAKQGEMFTERAA